MMTKALIIGYGSIGQRHARLLTEAQCDVSVLSQQDQTSFPAFKDLHTALEKSWPDYVVIANETAKHAATIEALGSTGYHGRLLVEKPLTSFPVDVRGNAFSKFAVGYNLRFHPVMLALRERLGDDPPLAIQARCGQHLSTWRPDRDMTSTYSASSTAGGGVLRDLSHELDYLMWIGGPWTKVASLGGKLGVLDIEADEAWSILLELRNCPLVTLHLNYLDQPATREIIVTTRTATLQADIVRGTLFDGSRTEQFACDRDDTYRAMHDAMLSNEYRQLCTINEASAVDGLIDAVETAADQKSWVSA